MVSLPRNLNLNVSYKYKKRGYSNHYCLKYPIKCKKISLTRRLTDFKKCVNTTKCFILSFYTTKCFILSFYTTKCFIFKFYSTKCFIIFFIKVKMQKNSKYQIAIFLSCKSLSYSSKYVIIILYLKEVCYEYYRQKIN